LALVNEGGKAGGACMDGAFADVACAGGACVDGACVGGACMGGACIDGACIGGACAGRACADEACVGGACVDRGCADGGCADLLPPSRMSKSEVEILPAPSPALIGQNSETKLDY
jgi:hypothetical protein